MKPSIEVSVLPSGEIRIEAMNFKGADCEKATRFLEEALGQIGKRVKKPEYDLCRRTVQRQEVGS
ncbi:MAG: DUF2997 domain-containing protein [Verrucomicrobia bacterium]|nr:DUF2997 domain-containing protein [Verrucomicrobiota bacterium]